MLPSRWTASWTGAGERPPPWPWCRARPRPHPPRSLPLRCLLLLNRPAPRLGAEAAHAAQSSVRWAASAQRTELTPSHGAHAVMPAGESGSRALQAALGLNPSGPDGLEERRVVPLVLVRVELG